MIDDFLSQFVDGYLFSDLNKISTIKLDFKNGEIYGAAGYSILSCSIPGMELLGWLVNIKTVGQSESNQVDFEFFWNNYMVPVNHSRYTSKSSLVYNLVRHGLAHTYLAKPGIYVTKGDAASHMEIDQATPQLTIDVLEFVKDFDSAYKHFWLKDLQSKKQAAEVKLQKLLLKYEGDSKRVFTDFFQNHSSGIALTNNTVAKTMGSPAYTVTSSSRSPRTSAASVSPIPISSITSSASPATDSKIDINKIIFGNRNIT